MTTITEPRTTHDASDRRFVLHDIDWQGYEAMLGIVGNRPIRITYDRGTLELMSPSFEHEREKRLFGLLVQAVASELDIPIIGAGSTTWRREDLERGLEPAECFYLHAHAEQICGRTVELQIDPPPDLAIEIETSRSALDRESIYAALGVPELWRFDGQSLRVFRLQKNRRYVATKTSPSLPFLPLDEVVRLVHEGATMVDSRWDRLVREWVRKELAPRYRKRGGNANS